MVVLALVNMYRKRPDVFLAGLLFCFAAALLLTNYVTLDNLQEKRDSKYSLHLIGLFLVK